MFRQFVERRQRRDRDRVLITLWRAGLSSMTTRDIALRTHLRPDRVQAALTSLSRARLITQHERSDRWSLTVHGQKVAGGKARSSTRKA